MFLDFFLLLKNDGIPVTIREYLTFLEALDKDVVEYSVDDFYFLSRTSLIKHIARLLRKTSGNWMSGLFWYSIWPKNIPARINNNTSGSLSRLLTQEQSTPIKSSTAIAVVMMSASCMCPQNFCAFINFRHH